MAGTAADSLVALTNVVVRAAFPNVTVAPERNPVPFTVRVKAGPPAVAELGLRLVIVGLGLIVNVAPDDVPPDVVTVTLAVPAVAMSLAGTTAVRVVVPLPGMVWSAAPFQFTFAPDTKLVPVTVRLKAAPPAVADLGLRLVIVGAPGLMVKVAAFDVPPVVVTVNLAVPGAAMSLAGTGAVSLIALRKVVVSALPFHFAVAPETKFVPLIARVKPGPPALAELGLKVVIVGVRGLIVKVAPGDVPLGVTTVTVAVPAVAIWLGETAASSVFALTNNVGSGVAFQLTVAPGTKFVPVSSSAKAGPPTVAELGFKLVMVGGGGELIVNDAAAEGLPIAVTVRLGVPAEAIRLSGTAALSSVELTYNVLSAVPFQFTVAPGMKFVPVKVSANDGPTAMAELGLKVAIVACASKRKACP